MIKLAIAMGWGMLTGLAVGTMLSCAPTLPDNVIPVEPAAKTGVRYFPPPVKGCADYDVVVGEGQTFDLADDVDYSAITTSLTGCSRQYRTQSPCLVILFKAQVGDYIAKCGPKQ